MEDDIVLILDSAEETMRKSITHLEVELNKIRAGKANPSMLDGIVVQDAELLAEVAIDAFGLDADGKDRIRRRMASVAV